MEILPDVVVLLTAKYLTGQDLGSWSAVSHAWRERLNDNVLWHHRCDSLITEYLKNTECQVEPFFTSPEIEGSGLSPICEWRLCFMRQVHLWNNWRLDRHVEQFLPARTSFSHQHKIGLYAKFYKNDYLVTNNENTLEIWKVNQAPVPVALEPLLTTQDVTFLELCGDKIVVKQHCLIEVFEISISTGKIHFLHSFIYHDQEKNPVKAYDDNASLNDFFDRQPTDQISLVNHILVAMVRNSPDVLHVWNVETGVKVREERRENLTFENFYRHESSKEPFYTVTAQDTERFYVVMIYRLDDFVPVFTSPKYRRLPTTALLIKDHVLIHSYETTDIYRFNSVERIRQVDSPGLLMTELYSVGSKALFQSGGKTLMKFNPSSEEVEELPEITCETNEHIRIGHLVFLNEKYCLSAQDCHGRHNYLLEITADKVTVLRQLQFELFGAGHVSGERGKFNCMNQTFTKLVVNSMKATQHIRGLGLFSRRNNIPHRMKLLTFW